MEKAAFITIGDELLNGQVLDRNASYLGQRLTENGIKVTGIRSVPDEYDAILEALEDLEGRVDLLLITGGLGPTDDDPTKDVLMEHFQVGKVRDEAIEKDLREYLAQRGRVVSERDLAQADMPDGARIIRNPHGSAPAIRFERKGTSTIALPGVPHEMKALVEERLIPSLLDEMGRPPFPHRSVVTAGIGESTLVMRIEDLVKSYEEKGVEFAYLASPGSVRIRMMVQSEGEEKAEQLLDDVVRDLKERIPEHYTGVGDESFEELISSFLRAHKRSVATAESCTGGYMAHMLTSVAGASDLFPGSVVAYSDRVKSELLGVPEELLKERGAVSQEVVEGMASGIRELTGSDIGLATSGIMGPSGGSEQKPVGMTWMGVSDGEGTLSECWYLGRDRSTNIEKAARLALDLLRKKVQGFQ
ncbi:MAG: CinA family nicotinamide mononucleotide deamidase-related protein [Flavobacteriales bacterium]